MDSFSGLGNTPIGCGMGLRSQHYPVITENWPKVDWFEAISENYMDTGGRPLKILEKVRQRYPLALHGTALSIGSVDPLNLRYLERLKNLIQRIDPFIVSDHLCWSGTEGVQLHDLLPLPFTEEALAHVCLRVEKVQSVLGRKILLENVSTYVTFRHSTMTEWEFLSEVSKRSGCGILLDLNNIYVNAVNHKFDPLDYLKSIPGERVGQIHLAGHTDRGDFLFDTHNSPIIDKVWHLYEEALRRWGPISTLVEWDEDIPSFEELEKEAEKAKVIYQNHKVRSCPPAGRAGKLEVGSKSKKNAIASSFQPLASNSASSSSEVPLSKAQALFKSQIRPGPLPAKGRLEMLLNPQGHASGRERLEIYREGYTARIHESIAEVYEAVRGFLDEEAFDELCRAYADHTSSEDYNLNHAGKHLEEFLKISAVSQKMPFLPDLAKLEWGLWEAFHSFDGSCVFTQSDLAGLSLEDWERSVIVFQPSVKLLDSSWPVLDLWKARREPSVLAGVRLQNNPQKVLIGRRVDQVRCELLTPDQFRLIQGLLAGKTLGAVCEELAETSEDRELPPVAAWFQSWVGDALIVSCRFHPENAAV